jgi:formate dehydrogenase iron-sulfur subunit
MFARVACGLLGGIVMPLFLWNELSADQSRGPFQVISVAMLFAACLVGEMLERYQFFAACAKPRMPGPIP